jgi:ectoine hydroxylase-related dioxygenase (phytanoyl-CoA dioxygenase family)
VPNASWHTDYPATDCAIPLPAVRLFVFLETVKPRAAGTLVIAGSHQAMMTLARETGGSVRSSDAKDIITSRSAWLRALLSKTETEDRVGRFMETDGDILGCPARVVELTGEPGDVVLMHPGMMHAGAPNAGDWARMMLVQSLVRRDWMKTFKYFAP